MLGAAQSQIQVAHKDGIYWEKLVSIAHVNTVFYLWTRYFQSLQNNCTVIRTTFCYNLPNKLLWFHSDREECQFLLQVTNYLTQFYKVQCKLPVTAIWDMRHLALWWDHLQFSTYAWSMDHFTLQMYGLVWSASSMDQPTHIILYIWNSHHHVPSSGSGQGHSPLTKSQKIDFCDL